MIVFCAWALKCVFYRYLISLSIWELIADASLSAGHGSSRFMDFLHIMPDRMVIIR